MIYVVWNNGGYQPAMGYWLKSFNSNPPPVPGVRFSIPDINNRKEAISRDLPRHPANDGSS
jgi:hypothetical protein